MKMICVDNTDWEEALTIGKVYDTWIDYNSLFINLITDQDDEGKFYKIRFLDIKNLRKQKLEKLNSI